MPRPRCTASARARWIECADELGKGQDKPVPYEAHLERTDGFGTGLVGATLVVARLECADELGKGRDKPVPYEARLERTDGFGTGLRMEWRDVDLDAATWNRPADKMKAGRAHRVPLSRQALDVLEAARGFGGAAGLVFPAQGKRGQMLPDNAIRRLVSRVCDGATAHGFRSSFHDWAGETGVEREVAELCLAHVVGDSNERAYARSDLLERRRPVMQRWGDYVAP